MAKRKLSERQLEVLRQHAFKPGHSCNKAASAKGGQQKGRNFEKEKTMRGLAKVVGEEAVSVDMRDIIEKDAQYVKMPYLAAVIVSMFRKAIKGDVNAAKFLQNLLGEEQIASIQQTVYNVSADTAAKMQALEHTDI